MTTYEKKRKAALAAAAWYIEQEKANAAVPNNFQRLNSWSQTGKEIAMSNRYVIQRKGKLLRSA
jgi:hypothetical protein